MNLEELTKQIAAFPNKDLGEGASQEQVAAAEGALGVRFPESYRSFLRVFGWARFSHQEMYGLGSDVQMHLDLVRNAIAERTEMRPPVPRYLVPIMNDGAGNHYCLDTRRFVRGECPIAFWDHELGTQQEPERVGETFTEWLAKQLAEIS